jgi:hypothetical protein
MAKKPSKSARRIARYKDQADAEAIVKFGPELSGLKALIAQAGQNRDDTIAQAKASADAIGAATAGAVPGVNKIYNEDAVNAQRALLGIDKSTADQLGKATYSKNIGDERATALADLLSRRIRAQEQGALATQGAQSDFEKSVAQVLTRQQDLNREKGAFTAGTIQSLMEAALGRDADMRKVQKQIDATASEGKKNRANSLAVAGQNPDGTYVKGGPKDPAVKNKGKGVHGFKLNSGKDHQDYRSKIDQAIAKAKELQKDVKGLTPAGQRNYIGQALQAGEESVSINIPGKKDPKTGTSGPSKSTTIGGFDPFDKTVASTALDVIFDGGISTKNREELNHYGYSVRKLGLPTSHKRRKSGPPAPKKRSGAGPFGSTIALP